MKADIKHFSMQLNFKKCCATTSVVFRRCFDADRDSNIQYDADPDPDPDGHQNEDPQILHTLENLNYFYF